VIEAVGWGSRTASAKEAVEKRKEKQEKGWERKGEKEEGGGSSDPPFPQDAHRGREGNSHGERSHREEREVSDRRDRFVANAYIL
jgi:hypothetical protein